MPRIIGVDIPDNKKIYYSIQYIYGIGKKLASDILRDAQVDENKRASELTNDELNRIQRVLENYILEGDLRRQISDDVDRLKRIKAYRGLRHIAKLPVRGQRTKTNSRNARGGKKRATVGAMTKEMAAKLEASKKAK